MELTWGESMKDKAARLIPTPYTDIVEEATSELLLSPDYERIMSICDHANTKPGESTDLIRAVRRRIDHKIPKVRYFTVVLLEALIKNCGPAIHTEIAEQKGLLRDLVHIALSAGGEDLETEAKTAALQLILNCSYWFRDEARAGNEKVKPLCDMATCVRKAQPESLVGLEPDQSVNISRAQPMASGPPPARDASARSRAQRQQQQQHPMPAQGNRLQYPHRMARPGDGIHVDAIPIVPPTEEELGGMMDGVMLLAECLNGVEERKVSPQSDDMVMAISQEVRNQHRRLAVLISSGADLPNMEVLLSICDSQVSVVQRLGSLLRAHGHGRDVQDPVQVRPPSDNAPNPTQPQEQPHPQDASHPPVYHSAPDVDSLLSGAETQQPNAAPSSAGPSAPVQAAPAPQYQQQQPVVPAPPPAQPPAPAVHPKSPSPGKQYQTQPHPVAPSIDELFADLPRTANPQTSAPPPAPAPAPSQQPPAAEPQAVRVRAAADIDEAPAPAPAPAPKPAQPAAFPAPNQQLDPSKTNTNEEDRQTRAEPAVVGSLNGDDEFDAFLNNRLGS